ncbi:SRPBCC domain-containing protein [Kribbella albertanoniae]|uniref:Polyketide cyclase n=1 Tax=Kribbella albertanoniae TaxID=1266829 RepID=A0A4R4Q6W4_9ACTN|nr:SRPBCC domain-containing protein [Kribbella albertanoniae]TDC30894.1 polyketide cyclase [Kribbella albertanoniae]
MTRSITRELRIDASPEVVYEVISTPEHLREWWPDEADVKASPGAVGTISFGAENVVPLTVVEADPPRRFSFRWAHPVDEAASTANSLLATFDLIPDGDGTLLRFAETGFDEAGRSDDEFKEHTTGWDYFLPRLTPYAARVAGA